MPDRLIRFTNDVDREYPGLLSRYDAERNLVVINRHEFERLSPFWQTRVQFMDDPLTRVSDDEMGVIPYVRKHHRPTKSDPNRYGFIN